MQLFERTPQAGKCCVLGQFLWYNESKTERGDTMSWTFGCQKGLSQSGCTERIVDKDSRGYKQGFGGCASCKFRVPADEKTKMAEKGN
jgi:hypothetical protein